MSAQTNVSETVYLYDGSFQGFLCCIFISYACHEIPSEICTAEEAQLSFFGTKEIETVPAQAIRVANGLERLGGGIGERIATAFLSSEQGKELTLLRFARLCFTYGADAMNRMGNFDVMETVKLERSVRNEVNHFVEFIRFEQKDGMLGAVIHPKHFVLPMLRCYFCDRLPDENFLIFDAVHGIGMLCCEGKTEYLQMKNYEKNNDGDEQEWQMLWKRFFKTLTIEERRNEKLQMGQVYKRFWQDMPEMRDKNVG